MRRYGTPHSFKEGNLIQPIEKMNLTLSIKVHLRRAILTTRFIIVDCPLSYNVILGQPFLTEIDVTINQRMLIMKFPTHSWVGVVKGDQALTRLCYASTVKVKTKVIIERLCTSAQEITFSRHQHLLNN